MVNDMASNDSDGKKSLSNPPKGGDYSKDFWEAFNRNIPGAVVGNLPQLEKDILDILDKAIKENGKQE